MAYRSRDIYKGRRKFRTPLMVLLFLLAFLIVGGILAFYGLQQFIVYDQSGVTLQFGREKGESEPETVAATPVPTPDVSGMQVNIVFRDPSFEDVSLPVGQELSSLKARRIEYRELADASVLAAALSAAGESGCNAVVMDVKPATGQLAWASAAELAVSYGTAGSADLAQAVQSAHDGGFYAVARLSVCADGLMAIRNWPVALQGSDGMPYADEDGVYWLDPYNRTVRSYILSLMEELAAMGFDEILLTDLCHPTAPEGESFGYTVTLRSEPNPLTAVSQLATKLAQAMSDSGVKLSVELDEEDLSRDKTVSGQDFELFWRIFDRVCCNCTEDSTQQVQSTLLAYGGSEDRFVPVYSYSAPENAENYIYYLPEEN